MPRPSFQFYPGDWRRNANLALCTVEQQGVWINVMCLMHDSDEYGVLRWPISKIAMALRVKPKLVQALADAGVMKGADSGPVAALTFVPKTNNKKHAEVVLLDATEGPVWYSSRMVKDEYVRNARAHNTPTEGANQDSSKDLTKAGTKVLTKVAMNGSLRPNYPANSKQQPKQVEVITTLSEKGEGGW